jgi:hypothetical protein
MPCQPWPCRTSCILSKTSSIRATKSREGSCARCISLCHAMPCPASSQQQHCKLAGLTLEPGLVFCFQYPSSVPDRSTVQTMPYQTTLAAPVSKPFTQSRLRVCRAPISTLAVLSSLSACLPSECWSSRSSSPSLGLELLWLACLPASP